MAFPERGLPWYSGAAAAAAPGCWTASGMPINMVDFAVYHHVQRFNVTVRLPVMFYLDPVDVSPVRS